MTTQFDKLYENLSASWSHHQDLKMTGAPFAAISESWAHLTSARDAMVSWHRDNR